MADANFTFGPLLRLYAAAKRQENPSEDLAAAIAGVEQNAADAIAHYEHIARARRRYATDDIEIDDDPIVSPVEDGCWIAGWLWVSDDELRP